MLIVERELTRIGDVQAYCKRSSCLEFNIEHLHVTSDQILEYAFDDAISSDFKPMSQLLSNSLNCYR